MVKIALAGAGLALLLSGGAGAAEWNAYALDMKGGFGYALGAPDQAAAESAAMSRCGDAACQIIYSGESTCMAVADSPENNYTYGYSFGKTKAGNEAIALGYCLEGEVQNCEPLHSVCIGDEPPTAVVAPDADTTRFKDKDK